MNLTARGIDPIGKEVLFVNFNQDQSCISVGTRHGYKLYNCDPFGRCYIKRMDIHMGDNNHGRLTHKAGNGGIAIVEMLFCTSLVALVGIGDQPSASPRRLQIVNTKRQSTICELTFPKSVLAVKLNRKRLVVVLEEQMYIYDISNMKLLHTIETSSNPTAICALAPSSENSYLAYPSHSRTAAPASHTPLPPSTLAQQQTTGSVILFDTLTLQPVNLIEAHKSTLAVVSINLDGTLLATASDKGTVIRVFSIPGAAKLYQFRRGTYPARIYSVSFNLTSELLCVSSDTETVHIFKVGARGGKQHAKSSSNDVEDFFESKRNGSVANRLRKSSQFLGKSMADAVGGYLPNSLSEIFEPARDFASIKLPSNNARSVVALSR